MTFSPCGDHWRPHGLRSHQPHWFPPQWLVSHSSAHPHRYKLSLVENGGGLFSCVTLFKTQYLNHLLGSSCAPPSPHPPVNNRMLVMQMRLQVHMFF